MSIRVTDIPGVPIDYDITGKKIMVHDLFAPLDSNTKLISLTDIITFLGLPDQTNNAGKVLTTNGTVASWQTINLPSNNQLLPSQTGNNGKYLITNGTSASWSIITYPLQDINLLLPSQTGNSGKFLITNGTNASWAVVPGLSDGTKGDIIVTGSGTVWTINPNVVTLTKIQTINANKLLGNPTNATADVSQIAIGQGLAFQTNNQLYVQNNTTIQKTNYYVNSALISTRQSINFTLSGITYTYNDDSVNDRFNLNLTGTGTSLTVLKAGVTIASTAILNLIQGTNVSLNVVNNIAQNRVDVTINSSATAPTPNLQQVTDVNDITTNNLIVKVSDAQTKIFSTGINFTRSIASNFNTYLTAPNSSSDLILNLPNAVSSSVLAVSVNGTFADNSGNIVVTTGSGVPLIYVTKTAADLAITNSTLVPGQFYQISGVHVGLYNDGSNSGTTIILQAITTNKFAVVGKGIFYNPKYDQSITTYGQELGIYNTNIDITPSGITGTFNFGDVITSNTGATAKIFRYYNTSIIEATILTGNWTGSTSIISTSGGSATVSSITVPTYSTGNKVIWGGYSWTNSSGNLGLATDMFTLNNQWVKNVYNTTNYNLVYDEIEYDYSTDKIIKRSDSYGNEVSYLKDDMSDMSLTNNFIAVFQWGNPTNGDSSLGVSGNKIKSSYCACINNQSWSFIGNILEGQTYFNFDKVYSMNFYYNKFINNSYLGDSVAIFGNFNYNLLSNFSTYSVIFDSGFDFISNKIYDSSFNNTAITLNIVFSKNVINDSNLSLLLKTVNISDCHFKHSTFTIPVLLDYGSTRTIKEITFDTCISTVDLTPATIIYTSYPKTFYNRPDGTPKIRYYNDSDIMVIADVTD
ncbi:MAG: hypothetical protein ABIP51_16820 [Bacteroidia bacterium]